MGNTPSAVLGVLVLASPFSMMGVWVFFAWRYLDSVEAAFSNSRMVAVNREVYAHAGWLGKIMRLGSISAMLSMRSFSVRKRLLDGDDIRKAPVGLQKLLVRLWMVQTLQIALIVIFYFWFEYRT